MQDAPWGDDLCIISARGTGKSWGIALVVARDAAHWKTKYSCLIARTAFQGPTDLQGVRQREASGSSMSSMWRPARQGASVIGLVALTC